MKPLLLVLRIKPAGVGRPRKPPPGTVPDPAPPFEKTIEENEDGIEDMPAPFVVRSTARGRPGPTFREELRRIVLAARYTSPNDTKREQRDIRLAERLFTAPTADQIARVARWRRDPTRGVPPSGHRPGSDAVPDSAWEKRRSELRSGIPPEEWADHLRRIEIEDLAEPWRTSSKRRRRAPSAVSGETDK